jgi:type IX secretion system substrate protein
MKRFTLLLAFLIIFGWQAKAQNPSGTCGSYFVTLEDTWIFGWEGGFIDIYINGSLFADSVTITQSNIPDTVYIPVSIGDIISIDYTAGANSTENVYSVFDEKGILIVAVGTNGKTPTDIGDYRIPTGLKACSIANPGTCGLYTVVLEDVGTAGWEGGRLNIYINGILYAGGVTLLQSNSPDSVLIPVDKGDIISINYKAGKNSVENQYLVYNQYGSLIVSEGLNATIPGDIGDYSVPTGLTACAPINPGSCGIFTVTIEDIGSGGWQGGFLDIYLNGSLYAGGFTVLHSSGTDSILIPVNKDDIISIDYTAGANPTENEYIVYDNNGNIVASEGLNSTIPNDIGDYIIPSGLAACSSVGIIDFESNIDINISPNPNLGIFTLYISVSNAIISKITIIDLQGKVVFKKSEFKDISNIIEKIDLSSNVSGIYIISFTSDKGIVNKKIVIQ